MAGWCLDLFFFVAPTQMRTIFARHIFAAICEFTIDIKKDELLKGIKNEQSS